MSRTRLTFMVLGTLSLLVIAGLAVAALSRPVAAPSVAVAGPADSTLNPSAGTTEPSPGGAAPPRPEPAGDPGGGAEPFVQTFANQPGVRPLPKLPSPTTTHGVAAFADGCDHAYGEPNQCVPLTFPAGTTDKCAWLTAHGLTKVVVVGPDRQKLDPDGDKVACSGG